MKKKKKVIVVKTGNFKTKKNRNDVLRLEPICMGGCRQQALVYQGNFSGIDCQYDTQRLFLDYYIREMATEALSLEESALTVKAA